MDPNARPNTYVLGVAGVLGGLAGEPVGLTLRDYPWDLAAALWGHLAHQLHPSQVLEVTGQRSLSQLAERINRLRAVFVYPYSGRSGLGRTIDWMVERRRSSGRSLPAVFSIYDPTDDETPAAKLMLYGHRQETEALTVWLASAGESEGSLSAFFQGVATRGTGEGTAARLKAIVGLSRAAGAWAARSTRLQKIITGLIVGLVVWRQLEAHGEVGQPARDCVQAYKAAHGLLHSASVRSPEVPYDPLLHEMVRRANAFLRARTDDSGEVPKEGRSGLESQTRKELPGIEERQRVWTSNRELADLGNPKSKIALQLVEFLHRTGDLETFIRLGLTKEVSPSAGWPSSAPDQLAGLFRPWSMKQVRDRFGKLRRRGFIDAERPRRNGPLQYRLPKELTELDSPFQGLPRPEEMAEWLETHGQEPGANATA